MVRPITKYELLRNGDWNNFNEASAKPARIRIRAPNSTSRDLTYDKAGQPVNLHIMMASSESPPYIQSVATSIKQETLLYASNNSAGDPLATAKKLLKRYGRNNHHLETPSHRQNPHL